MSTRILFLAICSILLLLSLSACEGTPEAAAGSAPVEAQPADTSLPPTDTPLPPTETAVPPTETAVPPTETPTLPAPSPTPDIALYLQMNLSDGDALRGRNTAVKYRCYGCHADAHPAYGPPFEGSEDLPHILERGELRIADPDYEGQATTNEEYLFESIFIPGAYVLPGEWAEAMPDTFALRMTEEELANIMAWMASLDGDDATAESEIDLAVEIGEGDPLVGEIVALNYKCIACHDTSVNANFYGPEFSAGEESAAIWEEAEQRLADPAYTGRASTAQEYLIESIFAPAAHELPGDWEEIMPDTYYEEMSDEELADIMAWMKSFSEAD